MRVLDFVRLGFNALFAPETCGLCDKWVLNRRLIPLCEACRSGLRYITGPVCHYCGTPLPGSLVESLAICSACRDHPPAAVNFRSCGHYEGDLRELIHLYKFRSRRRLAWPLSRILCRGLQVHFSDLKFNWLVPVPSHPSRVLERGFDAVALLADRLSDHTGIPVFSGLERVKRTAPQFGLSREQRAGNLKGVFDMRNGDSRPSGNLLIVDDVLTTGTTMLELASVIEGRCRPESLAALTIARTPLFCK